MEKNGLFASMACNKLLCLNKCKYMHFTVIVAQELLIGVFYSQQHLPGGAYSVLDKQPITCLFKNIKHI